MHSDAPVDLPTRISISTDIIESWLLGALEVVKTAAAELDIPLSFPRIQQVGELGPHQSTWRYRHIVTVGNPMRSLNVDGRLFGRLLDRSSERHEVAARVTALMDASHYWKSMGTLGDDPSKWMEHAVLIPGVYRFLSSLSDLRNAGKAEARAYAAGMAQQLFSDELVHVTTIPISGLVIPPDGIVGTSVRVRMLTPVELGILGHDYDPHEPDGLEYALHNHSLESVALEIRRPFSKRESPHDGGLPRRVLLALALLGFEIHGRGLGLQRTEPGVSTYRGAQRFPLAPHGSNRPFSSHDLVRTVEIASRLPSELDTDGRPSQHTACYRFLVGASRSDAVDAIVDYCIALEAILLDGESQGESTYKFKMRGTHLLGESVEQRADLLKRLGSLYAMRSRIVHGAKPLAPAEVTAAREDARALASRAILKCVDHRWLTARDLDGLVVGTPSNC